MCSYQITGRCCHGCFDQEEKNSIAHRKKEYLDSGYQEPTSGVSHHLQFFWEEILKIFYLNFKSRTTKPGNANKFLLMRKLTILFFVCLIIGCAASKKTKAKENALNGTWLTEKMEIGGAPLPKAAFENQKLTLGDSTYTFVAESVDKGTVKYSGNKIDIYGKEGVNAGKHFTAIYKFENDLLVICYNLEGNVYPETFETKGKPMYFVATFKKEQAK
jgi:uncharacterized protein (TIGR03067 family)